MKFWWLQKMELYNVERMMNCWKKVGFTHIIMKCLKMTRFGYIENLL